MNRFLPPRKVLLCPPDHFDVVDEKNIHMRGQQGEVDRAQAYAQWRQLFDICKSLENEGVLEEVALIPPVPGCEDMVFCANPVLPWREPDGRLQVVLSNMRHPSRRNEVQAFESFFAGRGYEILRLKSDGIFEGMGDCIYHPTKRMLFGGYGFRTAPEVYEEIGNLLDVEVILLEMNNPNFYHLDTCLLPVDEDACLIPQRAFTDDSLDRLAEVFRDVITVPDEESMRLSLNAMLVYGDEPTAIAEKDCPVTAGLLKENGFSIHETDTSEFLKSGGGVFCMKLMFW